MPMSWAVKDRYRKARAAYFYGKTCVNCGASKQLQLDHIVPCTKDKELIPRGRCTKIWLWPEWRRQIELGKCQPLCRTCHNKKSGLERRTLTDNDVGLIRLLRASGKKCREIGAKLGVSHTTISRVANGVRFQSQRKKENNANAMGA